ncbi:RNA polymerase II transcription elongation factor [Paragonimus heterotremus]|uniref:RNA polymerase II transcription elongation factor n=1 Tax=Paragonimus heterotremus TaxID=100268 RepID=A0A8J4WN49_9TREM|nr:RNA polymerase II transcription elongation factor [Paragonimus heterotremus]
MEVYMVIRRKKTTIHLNARETSTIREVKMMIEGILKVPPSDQMLYKQQAELDDEKTLAFYNLNAQTARAHTPATLGLALRDKKWRERHGWIQTKNEVEK